MASSGTKSSLLVGKLALVTGASGTIGQAIAKVLYQNGASVVLTGRNKDRLEQTAAEILKLPQTATEPPSTVECIPCDVTQESSVVPLFQTIRDKHQRLDILVNNAGTNVPGRTVDLSADDFEAVMKVNVLGPFLCSREALKIMKEASRIINIGSLSAQSPRPDACPYTTSKFALKGLTQSLALDARRDGISVGIIHPGNVLSDLLTPEMIAERKDSEGFMHAQQVADCVLTMAAMPPQATVLEMTVLPMKQAYVGRG